MTWQHVTVNKKRWHVRKVVAAKVKYVFIIHCIFSINICIYIYTYWNTAVLI
jgi:hypothetical protein